ncbi:hypothetical protein TNCV_978571 [Trichonephila clavipes]|nr:hypothetical protein TNCV_978571 [Trichonephila clavipes]
MNLNDLGVTLKFSISVPTYTLRRSLQSDHNDARSIAFSQRSSSTLLNEDKGCGSPVVKVSDHGRHVMSSSPVLLKDPPYRAAMHIKSVENLNVPPLVWCGS